MPHDATRDATHATLMIALSARRGAQSDDVSFTAIQALIDDCSEIARQQQAPLPRRQLYHGPVVIDLLTPSTLLLALSWVMRRPAAVCGVWITAPSQPKFSSFRLIDRARSAPLGLAVANTPNDGSAAPIAALLGLHAAVMRARTPAQWLAHDAYALHGTRTLAARSLGISRQALTKTLTRSNYHETAATGIALTALLDAARQAPPSASRPSE